MITLLRLLILMAGLLAWPVSWAEPAIVKPRIVVLTSLPTQTQFNVEFHEHFAKLTVELNWLADCIQVMLRNHGTDLPAWPTGPYYRFMLPKLIDQLRANSHIEPMKFQGAPPVAIFGTDRNSLIYTMSRPLTWLAAKIVKHRDLFQEVLPYADFVTHLGAAFKEVRFLNHFNGLQYSNEIQKIFTAENGDLENAFKDAFRPFLLSDFELVVKHHALAEDLRQTLTDPRNLIVFWLSHAGPATSLLTGTVVDYQGHDLSVLFSQVHAGLRYLGLIGCKAGTVIEDFRARGYYGNAPNLRIDASDQNVDAQSQDFQFIGGAFTKMMADFTFSLPGLNPEALFHPNKSRVYPAAAILPNFVDSARLGTASLRHLRLDWVPNAQAPANCHTPELMLISGQRVWRTLPQVQAGASQSVYMEIDFALGSDEPNFDIAVEPLDQSLGPGWPANVCHNLVLKDAVQNETWENVPTKKNILFLKN